MLSSSPMVFRIMYIGSIDAASGMNRVEMKKDSDSSTFLTRRTLSA